MDSRGSAKKLDPQVEALCRLLAQIIARVMSQQGIDKKAA